ncbi:hypothetical protein C8J57DRAFT_453485 [Mycena rebaudengoi]|nr:hypothetical protein C8J57DRAFT_453485 [Mycena rebaudengoi]
MKKVNGLGSGGVVSITLATTGHCARAILQGISRVALPLSRSVFILSVFLHQSFTFLPSFPTISRSSPPYPPPYSELSIIPYFTHSSRLPFSAFLSLHVPHSSFSCSPHLPSPILPCHLSFLYIHTLFPICSTAPAHRSPFWSLHSAPSPAPPPPHACPCPPFPIHLVGRRTLPPPPIRICPSPPHLSSLSIHFTSPSLISYFIPPLHTIPVILYPLFSAPRVAHALFRSFGIANPSPRSFSLAPRFFSPARVVSRSSYSCPPASPSAPETSSSSFSRILYSAIPILTPSPLCSCALVVAVDGGPHSSTKSAPNSLW